MPRKAVLEPYEVSETPAPTNGVVHGYRPPVLTRRAMANPEQFPGMPFAEGSEMFWAEIRDDLTIDEADRIPTSTGTLAEQWAVIAPMVLAWNAIAYNVATNTWEAVPPPAEAGPDVFKTQRRNVSSFLVLALKYNMDLNIPKGLKPSGDTDAG